MAEALDVHLYGAIIGQMVRSGPDAVIFETAAAAMGRFGVGPTDGAPQFEPGARAG